MRHGILALGATALAVAACSMDGSPAELADSALAPMVDYRASVSHPGKACGTLEGVASAGVEILSAIEKPMTATQPAHCEVRAVIAPAVNVRVQLPEAWNGRFYMAGNGGLAGEPVDDRGPGPDPTTTALSRGFATAITDTGHDRRVVSDASFADDRALLVDYAYRAVHETAVLGKALALDYYQTPGIVASYWEGCSTGGRQALMSAQRFPEDFDGVIAGAPISDYTGTLVATFWTTDRAERANLSEAQLGLVAASYDAKCDALDGLEDGLVANFEGCAFTPSENLLICVGDRAADDCVTAAQATLLDEIVAGPSANGGSLHAGLPLSTTKAIPGGTSPWNGWWVSAAPGQTPLNLAIHGSSMEHMVFSPPRPGYDWHSFDFETDPALLAELSGIIDAVDPNLDALRDRGGKVLMYHGTADPALVVGMSVAYRDAVVDRYGEDARDFYRFHAMPGMYHCRGGYGPDQVDYLEAMVQWVEAGRAPDGLVARQLAAGEEVRSRPFCEYPAFARYESGDPDDASSFICSTE